MAYAISWQDPSEMTIVYTGQTSAKEVLEVVKIQHGDARFDSLRKVLHDFSGIDSCGSDENSLQDLDVLGLGASYTNPHFRIAVVTQRSDVVEMVRQFLEGGISPYPMEVFSSVDAATAWLGTS